MGAKLDTSVQEFILLPSGGWNVHKLQSILPVAICDKISTLHIPSDTAYNDVVVWNPSEDGEFSSKFAYRAISDPYASSSNPVFKLVWKLKGPQCVRFLLWLIAHKALLTHQERQRRHIRLSATYAPTWWIRQYG